MNDERRARQFNEIVGVEGCDDSGQMRGNQRFKVAVFDISRRDEEQLIWLPLQKKRVHEIGVFGDYDSLLSLGDGVDLCVSGTVATGKI